MGDIIIKLFLNHAPKTVENFVSLVTGAKEWLNPNIGEKVKQIFTTELFSTE